MIVDIIFVGLVIVLLYAIYRIKFKQDAAKIQNINVQELRQNIHTNMNGTTNTNIQKKEQKKQKPMQNATPAWAQNQRQQQELQSEEQQDQEDGEKKVMTAADRKKLLRKQQKARQKKQKKEALQQFLEEQRKKNEKQEQQNEQKQRIQEEKKRKQQQYYKMLAEEEQKRKQAQYDKWKNMFKVETEGKAKESAEVQLMKKQQQLKNFLKVLQKNKLSLLQDLAHKFKLSISQVIQKIKQLQTRELIKGIFDERGKYMVIQQQQWNAIRNYIEARGRIKKTDIMQECARIIKIPDNTQIDEEMMNLIAQESQNST